MRTKLIVFSLLIISLFLGNKLAACSNCSGNGYIGAYSTGGYNLYSFATDIYTIIDTTYYAPVSTSGCGSLLGGCGSCYGSPSLYGGASYNPTNQLINQLLISQVNQNTMQMCLMSGMCNPINPYLTPPGMSIPPLLPPGINPPYSPYYPNVVSPQFPYSPNYPFYNPMLPSTPNPQPPVTQIPYNGCDNIVVICPPGPVSPYSPQWPYSPGFNPWSWNPTSGATTPGVISPVGTNPLVLPPISGGTGQTPNMGGFAPFNPGYNFDSQNVPQSPIRYQTPRGAINITH